MIKVAILLGAVLVLSAATVLQTSDETEIGSGCKSETELWGSQDGFKFNFCIGNNQFLQQSCPPNTFFVKNITVTGCIPFNEVHDSCVYHWEQQPCEGIYMQQLQPHLDPSKFYMCTQSDAMPIELKCLKGAFVHQEGYLGCFEWEMWRRIRGCILDE